VSAEIAAATAQVTRSQYDFDRYRTLSADRFASIQRFEQADADYKKAISQALRRRPARSSA
jgi:membrane fusion protein (multidrug efflux system)